MGLDPEAAPLVLGVRAGQLEVKCGLEMAFPTRASSASQLMS